MPITGLLVPPVGGTILTFSKCITQKRNHNEKVLYPVTLPKDFKIAVVDKTVNETFKCNLGFVL